MCVWCYIIHVYMLRIPSYLTVLDYQDRVGCYSQVKVFTKMSMVQLTTLISMFLTKWSYKYFIYYSVNLLVHFPSLGGRHDHYVNRVKFSTDNCHKVCVFSAATVVQYVFVSESVQRTILNVHIYFYKVIYYCITLHNVNLHSCSPCLGGCEQIVV